MTTRLRIACSMLAAIGAGAIHLRASVLAPRHVVRVWPAPGLADAAADFPEAARQVGRDVGVAFSGGGTRSAAASLGQLRALHESGWLSRVDYVSAVSGGSWSAVPFTFSDHGRDARLLGPQPGFASLTPALLDAADDGSLTLAIARSRLLTCSTVEIGRIAGLVPRRLTRTIAGLTGRCAFGDTDSATYARLLSSIFLRTTTRGTADRLMAWDREQVQDIRALNPHLHDVEFAVPGHRRPFLIVNAVVIRRTGHGLDLLPFEMTPLYSGARRFHDGIGGSYHWSWAFDSEGPLASSDGGRLIRVAARDGHLGIGPADMMAASGAAPLLAALDRLPANAAGAFTGYFPHFSHFTVREGATEMPQRRLLHGDGGFLDNLGVMPLLARGVRNILVFVNSRDSLAENDDLKSYFFPVAAGPGSGRKDGNVVFEARHYAEVVRGLREAVRLGGGAVHCSNHTSRSHDGGWRVLANDTYGVRAYDGLNICFVYNYHSRGWWTHLPDWLRATVPAPEVSVLTGERPAGAGADAFVRFPWYNTFFENSPSLVFLQTRQVSLLAHLSCWTVLDRRDYITNTLRILRDADVSAGPGPAPPPRPSAAADRPRSAARPG